MLSSNSVFASLNILWFFSILDKYSNNNWIKRMRAASQIRWVPAKFFHLFTQASAWTAQVICCPSMGLYFDISINYAKHPGVATCTFLSAFSSMSWKQWAKSETWIQEETKWKSTEKSSCSPVLVVKKAVVKFFWFLWNLIWKRGEILKILNSDISRKNCVDFWFWKIL